MEEKSKMDIMLEQIAAIRESGETNMLDVLGVQNIAFERHFNVLALFLLSEENKKTYWDLIRYGKIPSDWELIKYNKISSIEELDELEAEKNS